MSAEIFAIFKYFIWAPVVWLLSYFWKKREEERDQLLKTLTEQMQGKVDKDTVKEVVDTKLVPVYSKIDHLHSTSVENTLLLREVSSELKSLAKDMAVIIAVNSYKHKDSKHDQT